MRVIITGSRNWEGGAHEYRIYDALVKLAELAEILGSPLVIVHGGCPTGADAIADGWARRHGYEPEVFRADWKQYGKAAGPRRNYDMVMAGADMCIGFIRDNSTGTLDCLTAAERAKIPTYRILWTEQGGYGDAAESDPDGDFDHRRAG